MIYWTKYKFDNLTDVTVRYKKEIWTDDIVCLDTECSSAYLRNGVLYHPTEYDTRESYDTPVSLLYIWQMCINGVAVYGRTLEELLKFMVKLKKNIKHKFVVYIHNASYEFVFLSNIFNWTKIFARAPHRLIYFETDFCQFRCSYMLTRLSLAAWGEQTGKHQKLKGDLDYSLLRTPYTHLTKTELGYCENDVLVMHEGLQMYKKRYKHICAIPLTQTGEVRRQIKDIFAGDFRWLKKMTEMLPKNEEQYTVWKQLTWGGLTHANIFHVGHLMEKVRAYDITSSYPYNLVAQKFPMSPPVKMPVDKLYKIMQNMDYCFYVKLELKKFYSRYQNHYLSGHKYEQLENEVLDNGRIIAADYIVLWCTDVDYKNIIDAYKCDECNVLELYVMRQDYLPKKMVEFILELFHNKTTLDGNMEKHDLYVQSKQFINSIGGMMLTDIIQDTIVYNDGEWQRDKPDITAVLADKRDKWYNNITAYLHGVWMLAYARNNLWQSIIAMDVDVIYYDTDSNKHQNNHDAWFADYNKRAWLQLCTALAHHGIPLDRGFAFTPDKKDKQGNLIKKGVKKTLGAFHFEGEYSEFKTLGAKRYAYQLDGELTLVAAGINSQYGWKKLKKVDDLKPNMLFEYDYCRRMIMHYTTNQPDVIWNKGRYDEYVSHYRHGICGVNGQYNLTMSKEFLDMIKIMVGGMI